MGSTRYVASLLTTTTTLLALLGVVGAGPDVYGAAEERERLQQPMLPMEEGEYLTEAEATRCANIFPSEWPKLMDDPPPPITDQLDDIIERHEEELGSIIEMAKLLINSVQQQDQDEVGNEAVEDQDQRLTKRSSQTAAVVAGDQDKPTAGEPGTASYRRRRTVGSQGFRLRKRDDKGNSRGSRNQIYRLRRESARSSRQEFRLKRQRHHEFRLKRGGPHEFRLKRGSGKSHEFRLKKSGQSFRLKRAEKESYGI